MASFGTQPVASTSRLSLDSLEPPASPSIAVLPLPAAEFPLATNEEPRAKRKKASRACGACQRAHLTCDDGRPCERCIKRGCAATCQDGKRKKAKYLRDVEDELVEMRHNPPPVRTTKSSSPASRAPLESPSPPSEDSPPLSHDADALNPLLPKVESDPLATGMDSYSALDDASFFANFDSEGAGSEYSILSKMLSSTGYVEPSLPEPNGYTALSPVIPTLSAFQTHAMQGPTSSQTPPAGPLSQIKQDYFSARPANGAASSPNGIGLRNATSPAGSSSSAPVNNSYRAEEVYTAVTSPYPYALSYHDLIQHLKEKFDRADIVRVIRALALFRPSLIALQMPLSEEDEIFIEKCFQRTLIEYEKLISLSGTPTVIWRRTCEICLVGPEFCMLTKWKKEDLIGRKRYIFELFDNASVVQYFEQMAAHAFENTTTTVMTICNLLTPTGTAVPCSFCFSIKRDLFSIPNLIVGQFLPQLEEKGER